MKIFLMLVNNKYINNNNHVCVKFFDKIVVLIFSIKSYLLLKSKN